MCTFLSTLPKKSKTAGSNTKRNLVLGLKPCPDTETEKTWYRFRLLNFSSKSSDRDHPFIQRYIHQKWRTNDKGYQEIEDEVICPVTKWIEWEGNRYESCPMCKYAGQQYNALRESNWKDADARRKNREFSRKYQAIIPVYVVSDPNYEGNNGKFKVIIFNDKKFYEEFLKKIEKQLLSANCFNGVNAVDICMHMIEKTNIANEGQPNEYTWKSREIDKIVFSKKPYDLPAITKNAVDEFPFDETYYIGSTAEELKTFYNKYIKISNDDIVEDEDDNITVYDSPKEKPVAKTNSVKTTNYENDLAEDEENLDDVELDSITLDADSIDTDDIDEQLPVKQSSTKTAKDDEDELNVDDLLDGLDID